MNPKPKPVKQVKEKRKYRKKTAKQKTEQALDAIVKEIVLARDNGCVCPSPESGHSNVRQPGHLISRRARTLRWDLRNVSEQCSSCNLIHNVRPEYYTKWFIESFGQENYAKLVEDGKPGKLYPYELDELLEQLKLIREKQLSDPKWKPYFSQKDILSGAWRIQ